MGDLHQLIIRDGLEEARARANDQIGRQCLETAFAVMADEQQRVGIMHAGFAMTALPHKALREAIWIRQGGNIKLRVESGADAQDKIVGLPYGAIARMILLYLQTEAVKTQSREIELGRSMNQWLASMGVSNGGKNYQMVREQSRRLSLCRLTFYRVEEHATMVTNGSFVRDAILPTQDGNQLPLWRETIRLDEGFYQSLLQHPLPVRETAIREIAHRSMALDVYVWLAYRLHRLAKPTHVSWKALFDQFGGGFHRLRDFRAKFREPLVLALAAYPEADVEIQEKGVRLCPSAPPIPHRSTPGATRVRTLLGR